MLFFFNAGIMGDPPKLTTLLKGRYTPLAFFSGVVHLAKTGFLRIVDEGLSGDGQLWMEARDAELDERLRRLCQDHKFRSSFISIQIQGLSEEGQKMEQETTFF